MCPADVSCCLYLATNEHGTRLKIIHIDRAPADNSSHRVRGGEQGALVRGELLEEQAEIMGRERNEEEGLRS